MSEKEHFRHIMLYYFQKHKMAAEAGQKINSVYKENRLNEQSCRKLFKRFSTGDFSVINNPRSRWLKEIVSEEVRDLIIANPCVTVKHYLHWRVNRCE